MLIGSAFQTEGATIIEKARRCPDLDIRVLLLKSKDDVCREVTLTYMQCYINSA